MVDKIQTSPSSYLANALGVNKSGTDSDTQNDIFKGLNVDKFGLSPDAKNKVIWAKSQFELNYQVLKSVNKSQGIETSQETFSFKSSYEFLQRATGAETQLGTESNSADETNTDNTTTESTPAQDSLSQLQEYFSPENTAQRILDVATSFFAVSETGQTLGNNEAARKKFADFIGGAIDEGFKQARDILGELPEDVETGVQKTHSLVFAGLADFVKNGIDPEKVKPGGVYEKIAAYRLEASANYERTVKSSSSGSYNAAGDTQNTPDKTSTIYTKG